MKVKHKLRDSFLIAAVLLSLSSGSTYAMPTGGNLQLGDVTNVADPSKVMIANANSIINWDSFSVGVGEKVTFDTQKFMVLNRVVGGQESQILGMLSDQGQGKLILINPSGIVLGENSVINANNLVLSTLNLSNSDFVDLANGKAVKFENSDDTRGKIEIKSGTNLTLNEALRLFGGKIAIADGVEIVSKAANNGAKVELDAGTRLETDLQGVSRVTCDDGTDVQIGKATVGTMDNPSSDFSIKAYNTILDKTNIVVKGNNDSNPGSIVIAGTSTDINSSKILNRTGDILIANIRSGSWSHDSKGNLKSFKGEADPYYEVAIRNSNINTEKAKDIIVIGGNVTLDHSLVNSGKDIFVGAIKTYDSTEGVRTATTYDTSIVNADKDTVVNARGYAEAYGANLNIQAKRFDNVIDSTNPIVKYMGKDGVSLWELMPYIDKNGEMNLDYYYNTLNGKTIDVQKQKNDRHVVPSITEKSTPSERIFDITPGYNQSGYNTEGGGLFVYNLNVDKNPNSQCPITFDLYNSMNAVGYIEYYDKNGQYISAERIEPHSHVITSITDWWSEASKLARDIAKYGITSTPITTEYNSTSKNITAPAGTYKVVVTNNCTASKYALVSNSVDKLFESVKLAARLKSEIDVFTGLKGSPKETVVNQILTQVKDEIIKDTMKEAVKEAAKKSGVDAAKEFANTLAEEGIQELLESMMENKDVGKIIEDAIVDTVKKHGGEIVLSTVKEGAKSMVVNICNGNPGVLGYKLMNILGESINDLSTMMTEKKLQNVKPMVFQLNY